MDNAGNRRVAILGHHGRRNLGDEALVEALVAGIRQRTPNVELVCLSMDPLDSAQRLHVECHAVRYDARPLPDLSTRESPTRIFGPRMAALRACLRWLPRAAALIASMPTRVAYLFRCQRLMRGMDLLIVAGSNQLLDQFGGAWGYPFTLWRWTIQARLAGTRVAYASVGAGPVSGALSVRLLQQALGLSRYVSVRDEQSAEFVRTHLRTADPLVYPDLAFGHSEFHLADLATTQDRRYALIAFNVMPVDDPRYWPNADAARFERYLHAVAELVDVLLGAGHRVKFFSTHPADERVAIDVQARLRQGGSTVIDRPRSTSELVLCISAADAVVATRFHGILSAVACAKPTLALCYHRKSRELMESAGLGDYAAPIDAFDAAECATLLERLLCDRSAVAASLRQFASEQSRRCAEQVGNLLELIGDAQLEEKLSIGAASRFDLPAEAVGSGYSLSEPSVSAATGEPMTAESHVAIRSTHVD